MCNTCLFLGLNILDKSRISGQQRMKKKICVIITSARVNK